MNQEGLTIILSFLIFLVTSYGMVFYAYATGFRAGKNKGYTKGLIDMAWEKEKDEQRRASTENKREKRIP